MMDFDKVVGRSAIGIPVLHVVTCGLFIAGYSAGFGGTIGGMFSASDFLTITLQHLVATYLFGLGIPIALVLLRHRAGYSYATDLIAKEEDPAAKERMINAHLLTVRFLTIAVRGAAVVTIVGFICQFWTDSKRDYYLTANAVMLGLSPNFWYAASRLKFYGLPAEVVFCILIFAVGVFTLGMNVGDGDRRMPYDLLRPSRMYCGSHTILTPVGARFISATPDNRRHLIDEECNIQFDFVHAPVIPKAALYDLVKAKLVAPTGR